MGRSISLEFNLEKIGQAELEQLLSTLPNCKGRSDDWFEYYVQLNQDQRYFIAQIVPRSYGLEFYSYFSDDTPQQLLNQLKTSLAQWNITVREV